MNALVRIGRIATRHGVGMLVAKLKPVVPPKARSEAKGDISLSPILFPQSKRRAAHVLPVMPLAQIRVNNLSVAAGCGTPQGMLS